MKDLKFDQQVRIHGIVMWFSHWYVNTPVFWHVAGGVQVNYINHDLKPEDIITTF